MQIKKNIAVSETGFVFNPTTGDSYSINQVGQEILGYLGEKRSTAEITSLMTTTYDIDPPSFEKYFYDFISMLRQFELLDEENEN
ncbi:MAG: PqqD family protein [Bacteroidales bacterium]|nr:PqqD family protein [Bacteroidales bacterium]